MGKRYEYERIVYHKEAMNDLGYSSFGNYLNKRGYEGWELVHMYDVDQRGNEIYFARLILKRTYYDK